MRPLRLFVLLLFVPALAHAAYVDPGSGSLLLQALIALVVGAWLTFRVFASNLWSRIRGRRDVPDEGDEASTSDDPGR